MDDGRPVVGLDGQAGDVSTGDNAGGNVTKTTVTGANPDRLLDLLAEQSRQLRELFQHAWEADQRFDVRMTRLEQIVIRAQMWLITVSVAVIVLYLIVIL